MFQQEEVIASVHNDEILKTALNISSIKTIFLMQGDILTLKNSIKEIQLVDKKVFLHVDFIQGLATDSKGLQYVAEVLKPEGIISTRGQVIQHAKKHSLLTIQRLFIIDSNALLSGIKNVKSSKPDAIEAMPGLMPRIIKELKKSTDLPIVAGGLIKSRDEIKEAFISGAVAVSLSAFETWFVEKKVLKKKGE
ncbi:glycerol uptake operon antiterminator regulatory protein GlpP [Clostridium aceticum]|uniref:Glycerol uptake operon antiterminator regulatory protein GlpP n=1 Tax=Clostridium aceticum TaxID=84022 RepID=A0A0D8IA40_9CLOT|nr:glycerol-3-phosphate responsive antiterminator [Clostridium aceticum]AKL95906.1 glycerol uptake operon antiterminator regulatory protein GlpP [Clostridium aceticum]KJF27138.1 hypothetical protein TZ02_10120 [Clostridium aceticum]